ncbi:MAG: glycoside hydrolase family 43 protein [Actinomycetota bacterium]
MTVARNPILPGCHPDPTICRVGEDYYLVTSTFEYLPGLPVMHSRDLVSWSVIGHVVDRPGMLDLDGMASSSGLYAPTLRHHDGVFWLVCTLVDQNDPTRGGNFAVTASDPSGPWSDPIWLDAEGIDPSILFDDDGRIWMHGTRLAADPEWHDQTEVWLCEFDADRGRLVGDEHVIWRGAVRGAVWAEGPHLYRIGDEYLLVAAEGGTEIHHAVCVARSDSVTGPYVGSKANPVLTHRQLGRTADIVGVGHADLVQAVDGSWWAVLLAMRPYGGYHYNLGRETFLVPVVWEDGWPVFAPGDGFVPPTVEVPFALDAGPAAVSGTVAPTDPRWTAVRALPSEIATAEGAGWAMPLRRSTLTEPTVPAFLGIRQQHIDVDVRVTISVALRGGEEAGLVVRQSEQDHVRLAVRPSDPGEGITVTAVHRRSGVDHTLGEVSLARERDGDAVHLVLSATGQDYALHAGLDPRDMRTVGVADGRTLDAVSTGGFLGLWVGVYGTSHGAETSTVVHVDHLDYTQR